MSNRFTFACDYAGVRIDVFEDDAGILATPLEPLAGAFGLLLQDELVRLGAAPDLGRRLGLRWVDGAPCISTKRTFLYLCCLDLEAMAAAGNKAGFALWEQAMARSADALHEYEETGAAVNFDHPKVKAAMEEQAVAQLRKFGLPRGDAA